MALYVSMMEKHFGMMDGGKFKWAMSISAYTHTYTYIL